MLIKRGIDGLTPYDHDPTAEQKQRARPRARQIGVHVIWSYGVVAAIWFDAERDNECDLLILATLGSHLAILTCIKQMPRTKKTFK